MPELKPLAETVRRELGRVGPRAGMAEIVGAWAAAVGEGIARQAWPASLARDGTLNVATSSSTWSFELGTLAPVLLDRLRAALGEAAPSRLRFAPGPLPEPSHETLPAAPPPPPPPGPSERLAGEELAAPIADPDLRALVARAAAASLARSAREGPSDGGVWYT